MISQNGEQIGLALIANVDWIALFEPIIVLEEDQKVIQAKEKKNVMFTMKFCLLGRTYRLRLAALVKYCPQVSSKMQVNFKRNKLDGGSISETSSWSKVIPNEMIE